MDPNERGICARCHSDVAREQAEEQVRRREQQLASMRAVQAANRASSVEYREACAAMHADVTDMLGPGWDL
jgi:cytochrome c551/c552